MGTRNWVIPEEPWRVIDLRRMGIDWLDGRCGGCNRESRVPLIHLPLAAVPHELRYRCRACGSTDVFVLPDRRLINRWFFVRPQRQ